MDAPLFNSMDIAKLNTFMRIHIHWPKYYICVQIYVKSKLAFVYILDQFWAYNLNYCEVYLSLLLFGRIALVRIVQSMFITTISAVDNLIVTLLVAYYKYYNR